LRVSNSKSINLLKNFFDYLVHRLFLFDHRLENSRKNLEKRYSSQMDVTPERRFIGFDAYQKAMDCLKPSRFGGRPKLMNAIK